MRHVLESPWSEETMVKAFGFSLSVLLELLLQVVVQKSRKRRAPKGRPAAPRRFSRKSPRRVGELRRVNSRRDHRAVPAQAGPVSRQRAGRSMRPGARGSRPGNRAS